MPGASKDASKPEVCGDNADNDCDSSVDEGCECDPGDQKVCGSSDVGECKLGWQKCGVDGVWDDCIGSIESKPEVCNGVDDDCDGQIDEGVLNACGQCGNVPVEICDAADNDCDGQVDEGVLNACGECGPVPSETCNAVDDDCDGATDEDYFVGAPCNGLGLCGAGKLECAGLNATICSTMPGASKDTSKPEVCGDNADNDCDSSVDEGCECDPGDQKVCGTSEIGECKLGWQKCGADGKWGKCEGNVEPKAEECNGLDDNCNGAVGAGEVDSDADGEMICEGDCNDDSSAVNTLADEFCNGVDDDCDGETDEGFFIGVPCVGLGLCGAGAYECAGKSGYQCSTMPGASKDASKPEVCGDNKDNDCDSSVDEDCECDPGDLAVCGSSDVGVCKKGTQVCATDGQWADCQSNVEPSPEQCDGLDNNCNGGLPADEIDADVDGFRVCANDCNDDDPAVNPNAKELCNAIDDDCDGDIDEEFFIGAPCVGVGACGFGKLECDGEDSTICSTSPSGSEDKSSVEVCGDNADNDCDGSVDEDCECDPGDEQICGSSDVGECQLGWQECGADGKWDACAGNVEPATELCNGLDDDCNGLVPIDEADADKDGWRDCEGDCDDSDKDVSPGEAEICNGLDDDCDGTVDEDCSAISCNICCGYGLGHPVVWWGSDPPNTWSADGYCGVWTATVQQICLRGDYPVPGYTDAGWADWNCQNGTSWGGWQASGVLWCVNDLGQAVSYEVVSGKVDPAAPDPEGEIILLDGLCK
ncbi:putative metal-binding motif-containing protein [Candidatus Falkowbacteria bacterium]|nr:putative metal-binding motif-containing protein [Candidatus Falkowbacteria bacterium]